MLNERKEYDEYTTADKSISRLKKGNLKNLSGIPRALTIIAREAYYERKMNVPQIKYLLNCWCGFETGQPDWQNDKDKMEYCNTLKNWLPNYIGDDKLLKNKLCTKETYWNFDISKMDKSNQICFDMMIADAINEGPLKEYYLVLSREVGENYEMQPKSTDIKEKVLKVIACYTLRKEQNKNAAHVNFTEFSNWVGKGIPSSKKVREEIKGIKYMLPESKAIFRVDYIYKKEPSGPILQMDEDWLEKFKPYVIESENYDEKEMKGKYVYKDLGCTKKMKMIYPKSTESDY